MAERQTGMKLKTLRTDNEDYADKSRGDFPGRGVTERGNVAAQQVKPIPVVTLDVLNFGETRLLPAPVEPVPVEAIPDGPIDLRSDNEDEEEQSETDSSGEICLSSVLVSPVSTLHR
ncbi:lectin receptor kinase [Culex quinquefasciatus]|uniref:Lectin receptor kinase n=1 Tax=Culex quinquefasciatus TaxID=7176 RepID=B0X3P7_CULQU|nr:lectin receptor kinase [Culex quinquefasciatus]|eukprot:XP_001864269.1 lectin receptor kinase [Culex quinquefasciatus]